MSIFIGLKRLNWQLKKKSCIYLLVWIELLWLTGLCMCIVYVYVSVYFSLNSSKGDGNSNLGQNVNNIMAESLGQVN